VIQSQGKRRLVLAIVIGTLVGCSEPSSPIVGPASKPIITQAPPKLTESQAIAIARQTATANGVELASYQQPSASFDGSKWSVFFDEKPPGRPGGHFSIEVDQNSKKATFHGGE
jgi:hypothetical protein